MGRTNERIQLQMNGMEGEGCRKRGRSAQGERAKRKEKEGESEKEIEKQRKGEEDRKGRAGSVDASQFHFTAE